MYGCLVSQKGIGLQELRERSLRGGGALQNGRWGGGGGDK